MSLLRQNDSYLPEACGFINNGSSCWFNAVLNGFLSCPSFNKVILDNQDSKDYKENLIAVEYINILKQLGLDQLKLNSSSSESSETTKAETQKECKEIEEPRRGIKKVLSNAKLWAYILEAANHRSDNVKFSSGQNCAGEGIDMFLDTLEDLPDIISLLELRTQWKSWCFKCAKWSNPVVEYDYTYKVPCSLMNEQSPVFKDIDKNYQKPMLLNDYIYENAGYIDADYRCGLCQQKGEKYKITKASFLPEILIVMAKRYVYNMQGGCSKLNTMVDFPSEMVFPGKTEPLKYQAVAQLEHAGTYNSGHYWAVCKRKDGWYHINDQTAIKTSFCPTPNTYIVFYHIQSL